MEFITSKGASLPKDKLGMETSQWFNIWEKRLFPYKELVEGDILYWFDTNEQRLAWKTKVVKIERYRYEDKSEIYSKYHDSMTQAYFNSRPEKGYFLHYGVEVIKRLDVPKPQYNFNQLGWERMDDANYKRWFGQYSVDDNTTLDSNTEINISLKEKLVELNRKMEFVSPERISKLIATTIRRDTEIVKTIKELAQYKCQYNSCGHQIRKKNGEFYVEVAHIEAVKNSGKSVLGNLVVLCPNHHKEFDYGERIITKQTADEVSGLLNGMPFYISTSYKI